MKFANLFSSKWSGRFSHQKIVLFDEDDFSADGAKLQVIKIVPDSEIKPHYHHVRTEAFYVIQGSGSIRLNDDYIPCRKGDYGLCKPQTVHAFKNEGDEDLLIAIFRTNDPGDSDMYWLDGAAQ